MGFNCLKAAKPLRTDSYFFTTKFPEIPGTHLINLRRMKGLVNHWSHPVVLNLGPLDWESRALITRSLLDKYNDMLKITLKKWL